MMGFDSPNHHHHSRELIVDCGYTKVIASRVGALGTSIVRAAKPGDFTRAKREKPPRDESSVPRISPGKLREFTLAELQKATANFSGNQLIGRGGFGTVYRGILSDGAVVAVKVLGENSSQGLQEFQTEMSVSCKIMGTSLPNLVPAIGYHFSSKRNKVKVVIVYPFMANGDVGLYLCDRQPSRTPLDWPTRKRIALGVARGICSLHELGIVHRDIKPANVMLDEDFNAHIGDLGLANSMDLPLNDLGLAKSMDLPLNNYNAGWFHVDVDSRLLDTTAIYGTLGYLAPEYARGLCSRKTDVFAFGVTLIQIVTGKNAIDLPVEDTSKILVYRAMQMFENEEDLTRLMHSRMLGMYEENEAIDLIRLGLICTQTDPEKRPFMPEVIAMMEGSSALLKQRWDNYDNTRSTGQLCWDNQSESECYSRSLYSVEASGSEVGDDEEVCWRKGAFDEAATKLREMPDQMREMELKHQAATKLREMLDQMREMELKHQAAMEEMHQKQLAIMQSMIKMQGEYIQKVNEMQPQIDELKGVAQMP